MLRILSFSHHREVIGTIKKIRVDMNDMDFHKSNQIELAHFQAR